jgi:hypothetical protein
VVQWAEIQKTVCPWCLSTRCRPGRPHCRKRRAASFGAPCECSGLHFPHRPGSKGCRFSPNYDSDMWDKVTRRKDDE